MGQDVVC